VTAVARIRAIDGPRRIETRRVLALDPVIVDSGANGCKGAVTKSGAARRRDGVQLAFSGVGAYLWLWMLSSGAQRCAHSSRR
jgi:hypothetical protein